MLRNVGFLTIVGGDANLDGLGNQETRKQLDEALIAGN
jgi:hypothetical protein